jgi:HD-GYP domain-containing protein (c-di-GMP phosphodiesterase class II)
MSSDPRSDAPSPEPDLIRDRGAALLDALEKRLPGAREHADATASWALAIAVELGLGRQRCLSVRETARLHEIGKLYIRLELLGRAADELTPAETARIERHPEAGAGLAAGAGLPGAPCAWIRHQHERFDGEGLPDGLGGEAIPLESRIIGVACAFDYALGSARAATAAGEPPREQALSELRAATGAEVDPATVAALERALRRAS